MCHVWVRMGVGVGVVSCVGVRECSLSTKRCRYNLHQLHVRLEQLNFFLGNTLPRPYNIIIVNLARLDKNTGCAYSTKVQVGLRVCTPYLEDTVSIPGSI